MLKNFIKRLGLRLALGRDYDYALRSLNDGGSVRRAHTVDIVVRTDGVERRIEADWLRRLAALVYGRGRLLPVARTVDERGKHVQGYHMSETERETKRQSFVYGNTTLSNPMITMETIKEAVDKAKKGMN